MLFRILKVMAISMAAILGSNTSEAGGLPDSIRKCVEKTAAEIQNSVSAKHLRQILNNKIHIHAFGARTYGSNWPKIVEHGNEEIAIMHYLNNLYQLALKTNKEKGAEGVTKTVEVLGLDGQRSVWSSYDKENATKMPGYIIKAKVKAGSNSSQTVLIFAVSDRGRCLFVDIGTLDGSSEFWLGLDVKSTAEMQRSRKN